MAIIWWCGAKAGEVDFEADTREKLVEKVANHFAEGYAGPDEDAPPPHYAEAGYSLGDDQNWFTAEKLASFNADVQEAFEAAIEGWDQPTDYEEHNTHWGLK